MRREIIYIWYYFEIQFRQIFRYWILGMLIGSFISIFAKDRIHGIFAGMKDKKWGLFGIIPACLLGIASPLCMYGTIPIAASFRKQGMREDWLAAFMMASMLFSFLCGMIVNLKNLCPSRDYGNDVGGRVVCIG